MLLVWPCLALRERHCRVESPKLAGQYKPSAGANSMCHHDRNPPVCLQSPRTNIVELCSYLEGGKGRTSWGPTLARRLTRCRMSPTACLFRKGLSRLSHLRPHGVDCCVQSLRSCQGTLISLFGRRACGGPTERQTALSDLTRRRVTASAGFDTALGI